jgi:hypothetical protein
MTSRRIGIIKGRIFSPKITAAARGRSMRAASAARILPVTNKSIL